MNKNNNNVVKHLTDEQVETYVDDQTDEETDDESCDDDHTDDTYDDGHTVYSFDYEDKCLTFNEKYDKIISENSSYNYLKHKYNKICERYHELSMLRDGRFGFFYNGLDHKTKQMIDHEFEAVDKQITSLRHEMEDKEKEIFTKLIMKEFSV